MLILTPVLWGSAGESSDLLMDAGAGSQGFLREPAHPGRAVAAFCVVSPYPLVLSPDSGKHQVRKKGDVSGAAWELQASSLSVQGTR